MLHHHSLLKALAVFVVTTIFIGCSGGGSGDGNDSNSSDSGPVESQRAGKNEVIIHETADADKMNPITSTSANAGYIHNRLYQGLLYVGPDSFKYHPIIAESRPEIKKISNDEYEEGLAISYTIRDEAKWDNGDPITSHDVAFSLKAIKNPKVDAEHLRGYYKFIDAIDIEDKKNFTFYCNKRYFLAEIWSAVTVLPEHVYDPDQLMRNFSVKELNDPKKVQKLQGNDKINKFAESFNSEKYQRKKGFVKGSGPYQYESWETGQRITLTRKDDWWGDQLPDDLPGFAAKPDKIVYEIIKDNTTAMTALKDEQLDVHYNMRSRKFLKLKDNEDFKKLYNLHSPTELSYSYIGMNMDNPKLKDVKVRKALAYTLNRDKIIETLQRGLAEPINGPIHPSKEYYNENLNPFQYNIQKANKLLKEAGWEDSDGNGIKDKTINGDKTELKLELKYSQGSSTGEKLGLIFKKAAEQIGVNINLVQKEWTVFIEENKNHNFEMYLAGWVSSPIPADPYQIWHTSSYNGGSNYVGFGDNETDQIIEELRYTLDKNKRAKLYKKFQKEVNERVPYIFLYSAKNKLAIHKRFNNANPKLKRPGFVVDEFELDKSFGKQTKAAAVE